jgi:hypothetical protein
MISGLLRKILCVRIRRGIPIYLDDIPGELSSKEKDNIKSHLKSCRKCSEVLEKHKQVFEVFDAVMRKQALELRLGIRLDHPLKKIILQAEQMAREANKPSQRREPVWRGPVLIPTFRRYVAPIGIAACVLLALGIYFVYHPARQQGQPPVSSTHTAGSDSRAYIGNYGVHHVYLCNDNDKRDNKALLDGDELSTNNLHRITGSLFGNHMIVLDFNTAVSVKRADTQYHINVTRGKIWLRKEKSPDTFLVKTPHSTVEVTGTTFGVDITDPSRTVLTVSKGDVVFTSAGKSIHVTSGEQSTASLYEPPTTPTPVNAEEILAWHVQLDSVRFDTSRPIQTAKDKLTSRQNRDEEDERFYRLFDTLSPLYKALKDKKEKVEMNMLVALSGAVFQVSYPRNLTTVSSFSQPPYVPTREAVENIALFYGYKLEWRDAPDSSTTLKVGDQHFAIGQRLPDTFVSGRQAVINLLRLARRYANEPDDEQYYRGITAYEKWIEDLYYPRSLEEEIAWVEDTIFYTSEIAVYLLKLKRTARESFALLQDYIDDSEIKESLSRISEVYQQEIPLINGLRGMLLEIVEGGILTRGKPTADPCAELIPMHNEIKREMETILRAFLDYERKAISLNL